MLKQYKDTLYKIDKDGKCFSEISKKFLKPQMSLKYPMYTLQINGQSKKLFIHKMVAETFLQKPNIKEKLIVNHKDGNKLNNNINNLEKITYSENFLHACYEIKTNPRCRGIIQLDKKYNQLNDFPSIAIASKTLGICASNISRAATKGTTAGGYYWRYK